MFEMQKTWLAWGKRLQTNPVQINRHLSEEQAS